MTIAARIQICILNARNVCARVVQNVYQQDVGVFVLNAKKMRVDPMRYEDDAVVDIATLEAEITRLHGELAKATDAMDFPEGMIESLVPWIFLPMVFIAVALMIDDIR